ncbi:zinc-binding alcohol dehydrogenase [Cohnella sp. GCM10027633]|uniref:zinc-dependent alcohol dehydrogenase n=1 Tax=unclassified Cohnella TaxID=2636738 RepID=UPI00362E906E
MGQALVFDGQRSVRFDTYEERPLAAGEIRLKTRYSGISAGTQLTAYRGTNPMVGKVMNKELRLFETRDEASSLYPVVGGWAYEEIGEVAEVAPDVNDMKLGELIYGTWGHRSSHIVKAPFAREHRLSPALNPIVGIFSQMGCIALNAVLDAHIHVGETVAVFGQGVPGQLVAQLAKQNGATVIAIDLDDYRLEKSKAFGADYTINSAARDVAKEIRALTGGRGADTVIEISGFAKALHQAIRSVVYNGRVVAAGFYQGQAEGLFLGEEYHHNRIQLVCSQIGAVAPELNNRWDRLRMEQTIFRLAEQGKLDLEGLVTRVVPFEEAAAAYDMLDRRTENNLQVVLSFGE